MKSIIQKLWMFMALLWASASALAYDFEVDGICYDITSFTELTVTATSVSENASSEITIPHKVVFKGKELTVESIATSFAINKTNLTKVVLNVNTIGDYAFKNCDGINTIVLQDSVKVIGNECFRGCIRLKQITVADSVSKIGESSFRDCSALETFKSKGIRVIGEYSFYNCQNLNDVDIPKLSCIPSYAFGKCTQLKHYNTPAISIINDGAFSECIGLEECIIPLTVKQIGANAFEQTGIKQVVLHENINSVGLGAFNHCKQLASAIIGSGINTLYPIFVGCENLLDLTIADSYNVLNVLPYDSENDPKAMYAGEYAFAKGSQVDICSGYFSDLNITNVYLGRNIKQPAYKVRKGDWFTNWAIYGYNDGPCCNYYYNVYNSPFASSKISKITIGPYVTDMVMTENSGFEGTGKIQVKGYEGSGSLYSTKEDYSYRDYVRCTFRIKGIFEDCTNLEEINFIGTTLKIPEFAFQYCTNLKNITIPYSTEVIGKMAFNGCSNLNNIDLGTVLSINDNAFQDCDNLSSINILSTTPPQCASEFKSDIYISTNLNVVENVIDVYKQTSPWSNFWNISTDISGMAYHIIDGIIYYICDNNASIVGNTISIEKQVTIPSEIEVNDTLVPVKNIISLAFKHSPIESLTIPPSVHFFGRESFANCQSLKTLILEDGEDPLLFPYDASHYTYSELQQKIVNGQKISFYVYYFDGFFEGLPIEKLYIGRNLSDFPRYTMRKLKEDYYSITSYDTPFCHLPGLKELTIGKNVDILGPGEEYISEVELYVTSGAFKSCNALEKVTVKNTTPPSGAEFSTIAYSNAFLVVPNNTVSLYQVADGWKEFLNVLDEASTDIEGIVVEEQSNPNAPIEIYNLSGVKVGDSQDGLQPGLYIKRQGNKTEKIMIK